MLVNPGSRRGRHLVDSARVLLEERGFTVQRAATVGADFDRVLEELLAGAPDVLVLASGDGTLSHAMGALAHRDVVLGILPTGTTNNFARGLDIPLDLSGALDVLEHGAVAEVDLGTVDDTVFANVVSLGISVHIAQTVSPLLKRVLGRGAYAVAGLKALLRTVR